MVKLRLQRFGKRNQASFRIVAADSKSPVKGKFIEKLGFINPNTKERGINEERAKYWLSVGAEPSRTVHNYLVGKGLLRADKIKITPINKNKKEGEKKPAAPKAPVVQSKVEAKKEESKKVEQKQEDKKLEVKSESKKEEKKLEPQKNVKFEVKKETKKVKIEKK